MMAADGSSSTCQSESKLHDPVQGIMMLSVQTKSDFIVKGWNPPRYLSAMRFVLSCDHDSSQNAHKYALDSRDWTVTTTRALIIGGTFYGSSSEANFRYCI